jgi:hypothetical protein
MTEDELHREELTEENFLGKPEEENKRATAIRELKQKVGTSLVITLLASVIAGVVVGFSVMRWQETRRRRRWKELILQELKDWIAEHGIKAAGPAKKGLHRFLSAAGDVPENIRHFFDFRQ